MCLDFVMFLVENLVIKMSQKKLKSNQNCEIIFYYNSFDYLINIILDISPYVPDSVN